MNGIQKLTQRGQSVWLDFIDRRLLTSGELRHLVEQDGIRGVTSNPTIFDKAISSSSDYDALIRSTRGSESDASVLDRLVVRDVTAACDELRPVYAESRRRDGFVSIEIDPRLANHSGPAVEHALSAWQAVQRPNLMIKVPGTRAGLLAIESCLAHGMNVNVTLLFSVSRYREVIEAHFGALEKRLREGLPIDAVASVASFFVSRVDVKVSQKLDALAKGDGDPGAFERLRGQVGIANAKLAYEEFEKMHATERWRALESRGGQPQRLLWASTEPKDPAYPELYYAEALVGPATVDTMTMNTMRAYLEHGRPETRLKAHEDDAHATMAALAAVPLDFEVLAQELEDEGIQSFVDAHERALKSIEEKRRTQWIS